MERSARRPAAEPPQGGECIEGSGRQNGLQRPVRGRLATALTSSAVPAEPQNAEPGRYDAFISYAREDSVAVHRLRGALEAQGKDVWVDVEDIVWDAPSRRELGARSPATTDP
jgi:hypothetical protein